MNKKAKVTGKKVAVQTNNPLLQLNILNAKFKRLKDLRKELAKMKTLYVEHDQLMQELLPLFVEVNQDTFIMKREVTIGSQKYRFAPYFYNEKKGHVVAKVWKSAAFETAVIE